MFKIYDEVNDVFVAVVEAVENDENWNRGDFIAIVSDTTSFETQAEAETEMNKLVDWMRKNCKVVEE